MRHAARRLQRAQQGVILFIALIVLVAMSLAGVALMRSVDSNVLIAGNLAFRQATTMIGDVGIEAARAWLSANTASLSTNQPGGAVHYWANFQSGVDFINATTDTGDDYDWDNNSATAASPDPAFTIQYVIHRLCQGAGAPTSAGAGCMKAYAGGGGSGPGTGSTKGVAGGYGGGALPGTSTVYYRVTVRVQGPRSTQSFIQAILN